MSMPIQQVPVPQEMQGYVNETEIHLNDAQILLRSSIAKERMAWAVYAQQLIVRMQRLQSELNLAQQTIKRLESLQESDVKNNES